MPQSTITKFNFDDERYTAGQVVASSSSEDISSPFEYSVIFPPVQPYQEQARIAIDPTGQSAEETIQGIRVQYGGIFEGDDRYIVIDGPGLTSSDKQFIRSRISLVNQTNRDLLTISARDIGLRKPNGIQNFTITIPYVEQEVVYQPSVETVNMLRIDRGVGPLTDLTVAVIGTPRTVIIDGGAPAVEVDALSITDISGSSGVILTLTIPTSRDLMSFDIDYTGGVSGILFIDTMPVRSYKTGDFSTFVHTSIYCSVSVVGSNKNIYGEISRGVVGDERGVFSIQPLSGAWSSLSIKVETISNRKVLSIEGTLTSNSFNCISLRGTSSAFAYKIEHLDNLTRFYVRNSSTSAFVELENDLDSSTDCIRTIVESSIWSTTFGGNFSIGLNSVFANMPPIMLPATDWTTCGPSLVWHLITLDGRTRSESFNIFYDPSDENYQIGRVIDLFVDGYLSPTFIKPWDGWATTVAQICGNDWRLVPSHLLEIHDWTAIAGGSTYEVVMGGYSLIASFDASASLSDATVKDIASDIQQQINDYASYSEQISVSASPTHQYVSVSMIEDGESYSPEIPASILTLMLIGSQSDSRQFSLLSSLDLANLRDQINSDDVLSSLVRADILNGYSDLVQSSLLSFGPETISSAGLVLRADTTSPLYFTYSTGTFTTTSSLATAINNDIGDYGVAAISLGSFSSKDFSEVFPAVTVEQGESIILRGTTLFDPQPTPPSYDLVIDCNIKYASGSGGSGGGGSSAETGIQVALGGYESEGVFYPNLSPNVFFEPIFTTIFPIEFTVQNADVIYLLIRTRQDSAGEEFTTEESHYDGIASYNDGSPSQSLLGYKPSQSQFTSVWTEDFGMPAVLAVPAYSPTINVMVQDIDIVDSLTLTIKNLPAEVDEFGFLGINRTSFSKSQTESKDGRSYGLVLDNRGAWDVLIAPEASLKKSTDGQFSHLGSFYQHNIQDAEESWDFEFTNEESIPSEVRDSISLVPVASFPQVWVLRIEPGVKQYLRGLRETADQGSREGCSIYFDILVTGRETGVQGTCRIYVYYDYTCVYEIELCDFFWNMVDPPKPLGPEIIDGNLDFIYESLVDCSLIDFDGASPDSTEIDISVLVTVKNIPIFDNGNALLLMKGRYTPEIQGFFFPTGSQLDELQFENCDPLSQSIPLALRINRQNLWLPSGEVITDLNEIRRLVETENSYMWIKPAFEFPTDDIEKECSDDEIVIVGIGYKFKNWAAGTREEKFIFGMNLVLPVGIISTPELSLCYKYYYNQTEG